MTNVRTMLKQMIASMGVEGLEIPTTFVKFYKHGEKVPPEVMEHHPDNMTFTSCQALKQSSIGDVLCLTKRNIGCIAAAITFGLVDQNEDTPFEGPRVYTDIMKSHSNNKETFTPPTPNDFTQGVVYACHAANRKEFGLFGDDDVGRYKDVQTAKAAIADMSAIQPATSKAVFFYSPDYKAVDLIPDVVVCSVRPVELTRIIQAYQYNTGKRIQASMGGLRVVNSDLIVRPYLTQEINISTYCLGARLIAEFEANRLGIGMPFSEFEKMVQGMIDSKTGFPFHLYPGAAE